ncbi:MAG: ABC transporter permease [Pseudomonadota bacterium]|nr:ABC transporter permease [Pseudomonadota bacterium]
MRDLKHASVFVTPAAIIAVCISALPLLYIFYTSLHGPEFSLDAYTGVLQSALFRRTLSSTMVIAVSSTALSLLIGYAIALHLARQPERRRAFLMILVLLPFWTSVLVKCYAFTIILGRTGIVNSVLDVLSGGQVSVKLLLNRAGVLIGMTNYLTPFVVFPVLASLLAIDPSVYRSASIMGAGPQRIFWTVTLPLSVPGILAAFSSVFVMALSFFIIPALLGGPKDAMLSNLVDFYTRETLDWNTASAIGVLLLGMTLIVVSLFFLRNRKPV